MKVADVVEVLTSTDVPLAQNLDHRHRLRGTYADHQSTVQQRPSHAVNHDVAALNVLVIVQQSVAILLKNQINYRILVDTGAAARKQHSPTIIGPVRRASALPGCVMSAFQLVLAPSIFIGLNSYAVVDVRSTVRRQLNLSLRLNSKWPNNAHPANLLSVAGSISSSRS